MAYITSISRLYKSKTLSRSLITEILSQSDWKEVMEILKERGFIDDIPYDISDAEVILRERAINSLTKLLNLFKSVKISSDIVNLYYYVLTLDEFKTYVSSVYNKTKIPKLYFLKLDMSASSIDELQGTTRNSIYGDALNYAISKSPKDLSQLTSLLDYFFIEKLSAVVETLKGDWKASADSIICAYKDYYSISLAIRQKLTSNAICQINQDLIKDLANSTTTDEVLDGLRRSPYSKFMNLSNIYVALSSLNKLAKSYARRGAIDSFMGSPFSPITALGISEIIRLDLEDLIIILNGLKLGISKDEIKDKLSFQMI
nr:V-type ATPase subunit [Acidianus sp. RZ1]